LRKSLAALFVFISLPLIAQPIEIKLRITEVDTAVRRKDTNFQLATTSGFSVPYVLGNYYLFGSTISTAAWKSNGTEMWDMRFPPLRSDPLYSDWRWDLNDDKKKCDPMKDPTVRDPRCGDSSGLVWKTPNSSVPSWNYFDSRIGTTGKLTPFPAVGQWPYQWPSDYPNAGVPGMNRTVDAWKINQAIPNPTKPTFTPTQCTRDDWNPNFLATGAADTKVVYANGRWFMAFNETINNPTTTGGWTAADLFNVLWATSSDGRNWSIKRILFRTTRETVDCHGGLLVTQLTTDNGYFYMVVHEIYSPYAGNILLRAQIDISLPDGYGPWEIASRDPNNPNRYRWIPTPPDGMLDTRPEALNVYPIMPMITGVKQAAIARIFDSTAPFSPSRIIGITVQQFAENDPQTMHLWSAPDLDTPFTYESAVDTAYIKPIALWGWEFAFTHFSDHSGMTPRIAGDQFDFWLNGRSGPSQGFTGYRSTATLSGGIFMPRGSLRTQAGYYVSMAADKSINAAPQNVGLNERWVIIDANGGALESGDAVNLLARNGLYLSNGGGTVLTVSQPGVATNETFYIEKKNGGGTVIVNGDQIAFRAQSTGKYIIAALGGGSTVHNNGLDTNPNTRFVYMVN
jgi:hypothetical protein